MPKEVASPHDNSHGRTQKRRHPILGKSSKQARTKYSGRDRPNFNGCEEIFQEGFFQLRAANFAERVARRDFHLRQTSLVHHADQTGDSTLKRMLNDAAEDASRDFTEDDADLVERADAVIAGRAPDGTEAYLLVEMSVTVAKDDVDRAKDGAELLQRAVGATTLALVIGEAITDEAATLAKDRTVTFAKFTTKRSPSQDLHTSQQL